MAIKRSRGDRSHSRRPEAERRTAKTSFLPREEAHRAGEETKAQPLRRANGGHEAPSPRPDQAKEATWVGPLDQVIRWPRRAFILDGSGTRRSDLTPLRPNSAADGAATPWAHATRADVATLTPHRNSSAERCTPKSARTAAFSPEHGRASWLANRASVTQSRCAGQSLQPLRQRTPAPASQRPKPAHAEGQASRSGSGEPRSLERTLPRSAGTPPLAAPSG